MSDQQSEVREASLVKREATKPPQSSVLSTQSSEAKDNWKCFCGCNNRPNQVDCYSCGKPRIKYEVIPISAEPAGAPCPECLPDQGHNTPAAEPAGVQSWTCDDCGSINHKVFKDCGHCHKLKPLAEPTDGHKELVLATRALCTAWTHYKERSCTVADFESFMDDLREACSVASDNPQSAILNLQSDDPITRLRAELRVRDEQIAELLDIADEACSVVVRANKVIRRRNKMIEALRADREAAEPPQSSALSPQSSTSSEAPA